MINLGIVKFLKKFIKRFLNYREIGRREPNWRQNGKESGRTHANQILLSRNRPKQPPSFFVHSFKWNQTTMKWNCISRAHHVFQILANYVDSMFTHCFYDP